MAGQSASRNATELVYNDHPFVIVNVSVWTSVEVLRNYVYMSRHVDAFRDHAKWFEKMDKPHYCLWWIPAGHIPTVSGGPRASGALPAAWSYAILVLVLQSLSRPGARGRTCLTTCRNRHSCHSEGVQRGCSKNLNSEVWERS